MITIIAWLMLGLTAAVGMFQQIDQDEFFGAFLCVVVVLACSKMAAEHIHRWIRGRRS